MAAIDFPAAPTDGQTFTANNGVVYVWSASKGLWLTSGSIAPLGSDFSANMTAALGNAANVVIVFPTVYSGNLGGYYNTSNGRFTPPAGRYHLTTWFSGQLNSNQFQIAVDSIRKNGVAIPNTSAVSSTHAANFNCTVISDVIVDANGTDYFEVCAYSSAGWTSGRGWFTAVPVAIPVTTPQMPNTLQLYSQQVAVGGETQLNVTVPIGAKRIDLDFNYGAASGDQNGAIQTVESGVVNTTNNHLMQLLYAANSAPTTPGAGQQTASAAWNFGPKYTWGRFNFTPFVGSAIWCGTFLMGNISNGGVRQVQTGQFDGGANPATTTGFRLTLGGSSLQAGSFLRAFVVP